MLRTRSLLAGLGLGALMLALWLVAPNPVEAPSAERAAPARSKVHPATVEGRAQARLEAKIARRAAGYAKPFAPGPYAAYHAAIRQTLDPVPRTYAAGYQLRVLQAAGASKAAGPALPWEEHGPSNVGGRTRALVVDGMGRQTWYAGSVSGGLWRSDDAGRSWRLLTPDLPNLAVSALVQSPAAPNVFYLGTGEGYGNVDGVRGAGIWKSEDRGETWRPLEATTNNRDFAYVNRFAAHPTNANVLVAATGRGLFRTSDGGQTWMRTYDGERVQQVVATAAFDTLYGAVRGVGVLRSVDEGQTWTRVFDGTNAGRRFEVAVAPSRPGTAYASVETRNGTSALYRTLDGGGRWHELEPASGNVPNYLGGQGWYNNAIAVHPTDADRVLVGGVNVWEAAVRGDSTARFEMLTNWYPRLARPGGGEFPYIHADQHALQYVGRPGGGLRILAANDGGLAFSDDDGATWTDRDSGYNTTQFYGVDKRPGRLEFVGGTQDNGTWRSPQAPGASTAWTSLEGGDGFDAAWHFEDDRRLIGSLYYNFLFRTEDGGRTWHVATEGLDDTGDGDRAEFLTTIAKTNADPDLLFVTGPSGVWRSDDFGGSWTRAHLEDEQYWGANANRRPIAISEADPQVVWAGHGMGSGLRLHVSTDGGHAFQAASRHTGFSARVSGIATHPAEPGTAYALFSAPDVPKVLRTTDFGEQWESLTGRFERDAPLSSNGFPNAATYALLVMPHDPDVLWAGTEIGLFVSDDGGESWAREPGLPAVSVWQLRLVDDRVVAATHGRGVWSVALPELAGYRPPAVTRAPRLGGAAPHPGGGVALALTQRSAYDSTRVLVGGVPIATLGANAAPADTHLVATVAASGPVQVRAEAYVGGRVFASATRSAYAYGADEARAPQAAYAANFDDDAARADFLGGSFTQGRTGGFATGILMTTPRPYTDAQTITYQLRVPIALGAAGATLTYDDVALIEPGENGTAFGDDRFWDYVVVEGSRDGLVWKPLADGYDAGYDDRWLQAYRTNTPPTDDLFVRHTIDLHDTFAPGDTVFVRFRLFADANTTGWGWAIDNLAITPGTTTASEDGDLPGGFVLEGNYPNPFNPSTTLAFALPQPGRATLRVYDVQGRLVATVADGTFAAGRHEVRWDATGLPSGTYFYRLDAGAHTQTRALTLLR